LEFNDLSGDGKPKKTILNFKCILLAYNISLQYNMVSRDIYYFIGNEDKKKNLGTHEYFEEFITYLEDICALEGFGTTRNKVYNWIYYIANEEKFNYVKECIKTDYKHWEKKDSEFEKLMNCIKFKSNTEFSQLLFRKALWQSVAMIHNENGDYGADGALTLQGSQGIGKTSIIRKLCECFKGKYFKESADFDGMDMKDKIKQNTGVFICELGEAAKTFKMVDWLKKFITNPTDEFRDPYARVSRKYPRLTTFYITINDKSFLKDVENRRYWTVEIADIDLNGINSICYENLWGEVYSWYLENPSGFRLTYDERMILNNINRAFRKASTEETILTDCLNWSQDYKDWTEKTATEIATEILEKTGHRISSQKVGVELKNLNYEKDIPPKKWRILDGKTLYNTPNVVLKQTYSAPYTEKSGANPTESRVTDIRAHFH